jgi:hypothetical protein
MDSRRSQPTLCRRLVEPQERRARRFYSRRPIPPAATWKPIKEFQLDLSADRSSAATMRPGGAYGFARMAVRRIKATRRTIRLKLLKIGSLVRTGCGASNSSMVSGCPIGATSPAPRAPLSTHRALTKQKEASGHIHHRQSQIPLCPDRTRSDCGPSRHNRGAFIAVALQLPNPP